MQPNLWLVGQDTCEKQCDSSLALTPGPVYVLLQVSTIARTLQESGGPAPFAVSRTQGARVHGCR